MFESWFTMMETPFGRKPGNNPATGNNDGVNSTNPVGTVSINTAGFDALVSLRGIGPELANAIISARTRSPFRTEADLVAIPGIGNSLVKRIRSQINFDENGE